VEQTKKPESPESCNPDKGHGDSISEKSEPEVDHFEKEQQSKLNDYDPSSLSEDVNTINDMETNHEERKELSEYDDGYKSDSSCGRIVETPLTICIDDTSKEDIPIIIESYKDSWKKVDQQRYNYRSASIEQTKDHGSLDSSNSVTEQMDSISEKSETKVEHFGNLLAVGDEAQPRRRSGSVGVVARRRSIFEIEDQEKLLGANVDPLAETIVILTNAEKTEMERKKEESAKLSADSVVLRSRSPSHGKGLVANRRSWFELAGSMFE